MSAKLFVLSLFLVVRCCAAQYGYGKALTKTLLYFEAQRSGKLPEDQRVKWRGDSALDDGSDVGLSMSGGYYDAGDNVKFGFPMAYSMTMLSWAAIEYGPQLAAKNELNNTLAAIEWGVLYLEKGFPMDFYSFVVNIGDGVSDHQCWQRPEEMTTPRTSYKIDNSNPGSDVAGETAAAMAAASIALRSYNPVASESLQESAKDMFNFATEYLGRYDESIISAKEFYPSSGYDDELSWAAAWLYRATENQEYLDFVGKHENGGVRTMFSWDDKYVGLQTLVSKVPNVSPWSAFRDSLDGFMCNLIQMGNNNMQMTLGGMLWWNPWNNLQYTTSAMLPLALRSDQLSSYNSTMTCYKGIATGLDMIEFARKQVNYILGENPMNMSYMVGYGEKYPVKVHHRAASIVSIKKDPKKLTCKGGFDQWYNKDAPNPNVLEGAIVGGPDKDDQYTDSRNSLMQAVPPLANTAPMVGVLARLS